LLLLAGCGRGTEDGDGNAGEPLDLEAAVVTPACESRHFEDSPFTLCRYDPASDELRLVLEGDDGAPLRSFAALEHSLGRGEAARLRFAMNAGMYDEEGRPIGLFVESGEEQTPLNRRDGPGNFHLLPNGVFWVDGRGHAHVTATEAYAQAAPSPPWATQSGPMLVIDGELHPKFDEDGESRLFRNGVCADASGAAWFAISEEGVSFGRFARLFREALGCRNALYLDGTVSSLWDPGAGRQDAYGRLGPLLVVLKKPQENPDEQSPGG
jgi:uncharacterized protein YigE (DUF2233 family)